MRGIASLLGDIRDLKPPPIGGSGKVKLTQECAVLPPVPWDRARLEDSVHAALPVELVEMWDLTGGIRLFEDTRYGQWGLLLWSPAEVMQRMTSVVAQRPADFRRGDIVVGEFRGDSDLVVVRGDPNAADFGSVVIALPIDPRSDWPHAAPTVTQFLDRYISAGGEMYWE